MFTVDEPTAKAIRRTVEDGGDLAGVVELRRQFPLISDNVQARRCVRVIAGWRPLADPPRTAGRRGKRETRRRVTRTETIQELLSGGPLPIPNTQAL
jgi:hypothetical protein